MTFSARYKRVLVSSSTSSMKEARQARLKLSEVRAQLRKMHAEADEIIEYPPSTSSPASSSSPLLVITDEMTKQLEELGYRPSDIKKMIPEVAQDIIKSGLTLKQRDKMSAKREDALDDLEENVLENLEALKKRIDLAKKRLENATSQIERLDAALEEVEELRGSAPLKDQAKLRLKSEWIQGHSDRAKGAEAAIEREIKSLEALAVSVSKTEAGLVEELQEANKASLLTTNVKDDDIISELVAAKKAELQKIAVLRKKLLAVSKRLDKEMDNLLMYHKTVSKEVEKGDKFKLNWLKLQIEPLQKTVDSILKEQGDIIREILRHENSLRDVSTEQKLQELDEALKDISEKERSAKEQAEKDLDTPGRLKDQSKKQVEQEDIGKDIASKSQKYKQQADAMLAFVDTTSQHYGDFILSFLAPDIPSDPKIESFIKGANAVILRRASESKALADSYGRNPMQRSAILLVPSLYEFLASTMDGVVSPEDIKSASFQAQELESLCSEMVKVGMIKEAIGIRDMLNSIKEKGRSIKDEFGAVVDTAKEVGQSASDMASSAWDKTKQVGRKIQDIKRNRDEAADRRLFEKDDNMLRRDPAADLKTRQLNLRQLQAAEIELQKKLKDAVALAKSLQSEKKEREAAKVRDQIILIQNQLNTIGESKQRLSHDPANGLMKGQEEAARRPSSDAEKAVALMRVHMPKLQAFLSTGIPNDASVEAELLRQSARIADAANRMIAEGFKAKKKYPNLPPTIQAYGHMFLAIDDTLQKALRKAARDPDRSVLPERLRDLTGYEGATPSRDRMDEIKEKKRQENKKEYIERGIIEPDVDEDAKTLETV